MSTGKTLAPFDANDEIPGLIETLHLTELRLEELTRGEVDTVVSRSGQPFLLRHAEEQLRHGASARQSAILNALPAHIALLDNQGVIISVNEAWRRFGGADVIQSPGHSLGLNYLEVCDNARGTGAIEANLAAAGMRSVLAGQAGSFSIEYPCHVPTEQRWFLMMITPLAHGHRHGAVVMHLNISERKRAEIALEALSTKTQLRERILTTTLSSLSDFAYIYDRQVRFVFANEPLLRLWGLSLEEVVGRDHRELGYPEGVATRLHREVQSVFETGKSVTGETPYTARSGTEGFYEYIFSPAFATDGSVDFVVGSTRDITARKQAENEVRFNEQRYRSLVESTTAIVWDTPASGEFTGPQPGWSAFTGQTAEELLGWGWLNAVHPDDRAETARVWSAAVANREVYRVEHRLQSRDGTFHNMAARAVPILGENGSIYQWIGVHTDITEFKRSEIALRESEARFRELADNIDQVFWLRDPVTGRYLYISPACERIWGRPGATLLADPSGWLEVIHPDDRVRAVQNAAKAAGGEPYDQEFRIIHPSGKERWIHDRGFPVRDEKGVTRRVAGLTEDITEKRKQEGMLLRAQRMESIGTLAGGIAHDLNNVLAPIMMSIELLKLESGDDPRRARILDAIHVSCCRGADLVRQVLTFARGLGGQRVAILLPHMINEIEGIISPTFPRNIRISTAVAPDLWPVIGDPSQLHQVLLNLAVNARDAMPQGGALVLAASNITIDAQYAGTTRGSRQGPGQESTAGPHVLLRVTDTGEGMSPEVLARIFEPFFTTKPLGQGTGIGLATVHTVVASHAGFLEVESQPGRGTTFKIYLPADPDLRVTRTTEAPKAAGRGHGELVLVLDDESSIRSITQQTLEAYGYSVITATDGAQGVALFARHAPPVALVLTDMMMPIMDGAATIRVLRSINPGIKIIATSGLSDRPNIARAADAGVRDFLPKPYTAETLLTLVREVLDRPEPAVAP